MTARRTYLDWNATAPLRPEAHAAVVAALDEVGNPSSVHAEGRRARAIVETARAHVARLVNARPEEVVFTSGATEANQMAVGGPWDCYGVSAIEHPSVLEPVRSSGRLAVELPANRLGVVDTDTALAAMSQSDCASARALVTIQLANNETGVVQPVAQLAGRLASTATPVHCDAVQAAGRIPIDFAALGVATMSLSAHKIGGPKGVGALIVRDGATVEPLLRGGGQERRRRAGTEAVSLIAGFGSAAQAARAESDSMLHVAAQRDRLERALLAMHPDAVVMGGGAERLPNTTCIAFPGRRAETLVIGLDLAGVAVGAGSACSSGKMSSSHVLAAMGIDPQIAGSAIRISIGAATTPAEIDACLDALERILRPAAAA